MSLGSTAETRRGFGLSTRELAAVSGAVALVIANIVVMAAFALTPLAIVNSYLFAVPIIGVLIYGAALFVGERIAERGVIHGNVLYAVAGTAILQLAFGLFGAGVLSWVPPASQVSILAITGIATAGIIFLVAAYVFARSKEFDSWGRYGNMAFLGGVLLVAVGTIVTPVLLVAFVFIFLGFVLRLGWEIWRVRETDRSASLAAIGIYIAIMGVFVHVLQIAVRTWMQD